MKTLTKIVAIYVPTVLTILLLLLLLLLSFDVFDMGLSFWESVGALLIHNIPTVICLAFFLVALKIPWIGGIFIPLGIAYQVMFFVNAGTDALISGLPLALIAYVIGFSWVYRYYYLKKNAE